MVKSCHIFQFCWLSKAKKIFGNILHDHWVFATLLVFWFKILLQNADFGTNLALATLDYLMVHKFAMIQNVNVGVACNSRILFCQSSFYLGTNVLHKLWIQLSLPYKKLKVLTHCVMATYVSKCFQVQVELSLNTCQGLGAIGFSNFLLWIEILQTNSICEVFEF